MVASIGSSTVNNWSESLFNKLDNKKQGYVDQADLAAALGADAADAAPSSEDAAAILKQIDGDDDGKITQSELSTAIGKVADELNAQFDSSRVDKSQAMGATGVAGTDGAARSAPPAGGGAAPVAASSTGSDNKYVQAADTDTDGTVSDAEAAAYKKRMAAQAEGTSGSNVDGADSDQELARALDQLKQYVENSGDGAVPGTSTVDVNA
jgi:hypothetical protein